MAVAVVGTDGGLPKNAIPVVHNVFRRNKLYKSDSIYKESLPVTCEDNIMEKAYQLLTDRHSLELVERHSRAVKKMVLKFKNGIYLKDLPLLLKIVQKCHDFISHDTCYENLLCSITELVRKPMLTEKFSDEKTYMDDAVEFLSELGILAEALSDNVKVSVCSSVASLYSYSESQSVLHDVKPVSTAFIKSVVERSSICRSVAECCSQVSNMDTRFLIIKAMSSLSDSCLTCSDLLTAGAANQVCCCLSLVNNDYRFVFNLAEVLWNLITYGPAEQVASEVNCQQCISALQDQLIYRTQKASSVAERQLRNDLMTITTLVALRCERSIFADTGFAQTLALYACYPEVASRSPLLDGFKYQQFPEDLEFKMLLFNILVLLSEDGQCLQMMREKQVLLGLMEFVRPINGLNSNWSVAAFEELQLHALAVLCTLAPMCQEDFMNSRGNTRLLMFLEWSISSEDFGGHGNGFHGFGGRGSKRSQMRYCIRVLRSLCADGNATVIQDLVDQGAIGQLVDILYSSSTNTDENDDVDIEIQCNMLNCLAAICDSDSHRKALLGEVGVTMLVQYLRGYSSTGDQKLVLAAIDCVWSAVIGCHMNENHFLEKEGVFLLLDMLEVSAAEMRSALLGTILDLAENSKCLTHLMAWQGKDRVSLAKLLVTIWKDEEQTLGVAREATGIIKHPSRPLLTLLQANECFSSLPTSHASPAIIDISDNPRAKIFSLFCKIGFNNVPGLLPGDYVIVAVIEKFFHFKTLEVWQEISAELQLDGVVPVSYDQEQIVAIQNMLISIAENVRQVQMAIIQSENDYILTEEHNFYQKMKESHAVEEARRHDFAEYLARTSDQVYLQTARRQQIEAIERSRLVSRSQRKNLEMTHKTVDTILQTTTYPGRHVTIQSTALPLDSPNLMKMPSHRLGFQDV